MRFIISGLVAASLFGVGAHADAQTRSPWQMHQGEGIRYFGFTTAYHGAEIEYDYASIPAADDGGWTAAPNPETIGYSIPTSTLCGAVACRAGGQFTYFQTFVNIPANVVVTTFTIAFSGVDDGVRVTIFNSANPTGVVVPGSYVFLGGSGTADLASLVVSGEINRVVVTHVDDCCEQSHLSTAAVVLNGAVVDTDTDGDDDGVPGDADCDDADPTIGVLLYENSFDADTGFFQPTPQLSSDPWIYDEGAVVSTGGGQQAMLGQKQSWANTITYATLSADGTWGGCCGSEGPINRWRAGIVVRGALDADQDEGYHGYRCALSSNAETVGGVPHSGASTGHFLQLAEFMDLTEDDIQSECEDGPNTTFDELDRANHGILDLAAGAPAQLTFRAVGSSLHCEITNGKDTVSVSATDDSFGQGTIGLSTLNMFGRFQHIKVCEVIDTGTCEVGESEPDPGRAGTGTGDSDDEPGEESEGGQALPLGSDRQISELDQRRASGCNASGGAGGLGTAILLIVLGAVMWRRRVVCRAL